MTDELLLYIFYTGGKTVIDPVTETIIATIAYEAIKKALKNITQKEINDAELILETYNKNIIPKETSRAEQIRDLNKAFSKKELVLVLGSGVSMSSGLPDWDTLLQRLLVQIELGKNKSKTSLAIITKLFTEVFAPNPLIAARYVRQHCDSDRIGKKKSFEKLVHDALYEKELVNNEKFFEEVKQFCIGGDFRADSIITYNFDDLLENFLLANHIPYKLVYKEGMRPSKQETTIYHVHGFLPQNGASDGLITLSEDMYHQQYYDFYNWSNLLQINKFTDKTCLFIGFSLTDPNTRRLLDISLKQKGTSNKRHYLIRKKVDHKKVQKKIGIHIAD